MSITTAPMPLPKVAKRARNATTAAECRLQDAVSARRCPSRRGWATEAPCRTHDLDHGPIAKPIMQARAGDWRSNTGFSRESPTTVSEWWCA
jgi:hypothetical protein